MANRIKGITVEIGGNTTKLENALKDVNKTIKTTQSNLRDVEKLLKMDPGNTELLKQKQDYLNEAIESTKEKLEKEKEALRQLNEANAGGDLTEEQKALQREIASTEQELAKLKKESSDFGSVFKQQCQVAGDAMKQVGSKVKEVGDGITSVGSSLTKNVTAPILAVGGASIAAFKEVDAGLDSVVKKTGATGAELEALKGVVKEVYGELPVSAQEAGNAVGEVNTRFKVTGKELKSLSTQFLKFASINDTDVVSAIDSVDFIMEKFNIDASKTTDVLDIMTKVSQNTSVSIETLENMLSTNGATLKEMGLSLEESVNLLAQFEANGVDTSQAISGLKRAVQNATKDGLSMDEALGQTIESIKEAKDETEALQIATELFGSKGALEMTQAIRDGRLSIDDLAKSMSDYSGSVENTFANTQDVTDTAAVALNNLKLAGSELGEEILIEVAPALEDLIQAAKDVTEWFSGLDDDTKKMIITIAGVVAAIGPVLVIIGTLVSSIGSVISFVGTLTSAFGSVSAFITGTVVPAITALVGTIGLPVVAAIGLVVAAIAIWIKNWEDIKELARLVGEFLYETYDKMMTGLADTIVNITDSVTELWENIKKFFSDMAADAFNWGADIIGGIVDGIKSMVGKVGEAAEGIASKIAEYIHFSEPDVGPLSDFHTFMPDMIKNMKTGIEANIGMLDNPMTDLSSALVPKSDYSEITSRMDKYMPNVGTQPVQVILEGETRELFKAYTKQNTINQKMHGYSH